LENISFIGLYSIIILQWTVQKHKIDLIVESYDETRFVSHLEGRKFCVRDFKFLCEINRGFVPPLKVNVYCFVRKIKLSDRIMYVGVAKKTLKHTAFRKWNDGLLK
jgi:hypothetical protein